MVGFAFALLFGCGQSRVPVDLMANDPLSTEQICGLEQVDQRKDGAHTALGEFQASQFVRLLRPVHGRTVDQGMVDRVADKARRAGWTVTQVPTSGGYRGHKVMKDLDVRLTISVSFDDRRIGIAMIALNEEGRD